MTAIDEQVKPREQYIMILISQIHHKTIVPRMTDQKMKPVS